MRISDDNGIMSIDKPFEKYRLFIAIAAPGEIKERIASVQDELRTIVGDEVRWSSRDQFHLTLRFLGNVDARRVDQLVTSLERACAGYPQMKLRAQGVGFFPNNKRPRVIWVGVRDAAEFLPKLQMAIESASEDFTVEKPEGRFAGHITVGRIKELKRMQTQALAKLADDMAERVLGEWVADEVDLIQSELSSQGSRYTTLAAIPLNVS